ncbi:MAG TPA: ABC transporter substrate-binding protein, partial [Micromonospora sp.]
DPLLVVAETDEQPSPAAEPVTPDEVDTAIKAWRNRLPVRRQKLDEGARYLYIRLPERATAVRAAPDRDAWDIQPTFRPGQPPWLARQRVLTAVVTLAVVGAGALPAVRSWQHVRADCAVSGIPADWGPGTIQVEPRAVGGGRAQCVGYSDSGRFVFGRDNRLRETQRLVFRQNDEARRIREQNRHRPLVTLVYFSSLTHPSGRPQRGDQVVAEELEGLLLRQREYNNDASNRGPLLRVIVANGGEAMGAARGVVSDFLLPLLAEDPTIVGVVGLDRTVPETEAAISELGLRAGVPVVGTMLTGTGLTGLSPLYFQMVPGNAQQAELIDRYAATSRKNVSVYYPAGTGDSYVETLVAEFAKLGPAGCAGGDLPEIVADDTTSRFVATRDVVHLSNLARVPVSYVALGSPVVLAGPQCVQGRYAGSDDRLVGFCRGYHRLREELNSTLPEPDRVTSLWPADEIGIAYDTAELFLHAVSEVQRNAGTDYGATPHRSALALKFVETTFQGATGIVDFTRHRDGTDRNRAIVRIDDISAADSEPTCRFFIDVRDQAAGDVNRCDKLADAGTGG